jgi:hypothetical protein
MAEETARMVFADPPYNVKIDGHVGGAGKVKHREFAMASGEMSEDQFSRFLTQVLGNMADASCDGSIHLVCMDWRHMSELITAGGRIYDELKNLVVWTKTNGGMGTFYRSRHELIFSRKAHRPTSTRSGSVRPGAIGPMSGSIPASIPSGTIATTSLPCTRRSSPWPWWRTPSRTYPDAAISCSMPSVDRARP